MTPTTYWLAWARREERRLDPKHPEHGCTECVCGRVVRIGVTCVCQGGDGKPLKQAALADPPAPVPRRAT